MKKPRWKAYEPEVSPSYMRAWNLLESVRQRQAAHGGPGCCKQHTKLLAKREAAVMEETRLARPVLVSKALELIEAGQQAAEHLARLRQLHQWWPVRTDFNISNLRGEAASLPAWEITRDLHRCRVKCFGLMAHTTFAGSDALRMLHLALRFDEWHVRQAIEEAAREAEEIRIDLAARKLNLLPGFNGLNHSDADLLAEDRASMISGG